MSPILNEGDFVITASPWLSRLFTKRITPGQLVVAKHMLYPVLIKRVVQVYPTGCFTLRGENTTSLSTQKIGIMSASSLLGIVLFNIKRLS